MLAIIRQKNSFDSQCEWRVHLFKTQHKGAYDNGKIRRNTNLSYFVYIFYNYIYIYIYTSLLSIFNLHIEKKLLYEPKKYMNKQKK